MLNIWLGYPFFVFFKFPFVHFFVVLLLQVYNLRFDSTHGPFKGHVAKKDNKTLVVEGREIHVFAEYVCFAEKTKRNSSNKFQFVGKILHKFLGEVPVQIISLNPVEYSLMLIRQLPT